MALNNQRIALNNQRIALNNERIALKNKRIALRALQEDFEIKGQIWSQAWFPSDWFGKEQKATAQEDDVWHKKSRGMAAKVLEKITKMKRGLSGFINGRRISALADTGAAQNVISEAYVKEKQLQVNGSPCSFKLGNSKNVQSIGERW